eukprot:2779525-Pyramimonas_sp.AAC.1
MERSTRATAVVSLEHALPHRSRTVSRTVSQSVRQAGRQAVAQTVGRGGSIFNRRVAASVAAL